MTAYCGLQCDTCPIYLATRVRNKKEQQKLRSKIARLCREQYGLTYKTIDITDCDGCKTRDGRLFHACRSCRIRNCAITKQIESCAYCSDYPCAYLEPIFTEDPEAKKRLNNIRKRWCG